LLTRPRVSKIRTGIALDAPPSEFDMPSDQIPFALTLPSDLRLLALARTFIETACEALNFDVCFAESIQLAVHEALQNIIRHAYDGRADALLEIQVIPREGSLEVRLLDEGKPFDVSNVPYLEPGEIRIGGRGVYLMRRLVDELASETRCPKGNILRLIKHHKPTIRRQLA
jgi:anti-sigma regulatory factor (Ser/Thr protein kinase)